jgi:dipeptidase
MDLPDLGPVPTEHFDPRSLWWKHELLHRCAMADFDTLVPEIRRDFDLLEESFLAQAETVKHGTPGEKTEFMQYCFREALKATESWIVRLQKRHDLRYSDPSYRAMWAKLNAEAGLTSLPDET